MNNIFCGIEKLSLVDFDKKLSCVLFISGCNFKCPFCHNSSLMNVTNDNIDFNEIKDYLIKSNDCLYCSASGTSIHSTVLSKFFLTSDLISSNETAKNSLLALILFSFLS